MTEDETNKIDSTIRSALEYYDINCEKYHNFINKIKYIKLINNNHQTDEIVFLDKNKNILLQSSYEILGIYLPKQNIWKWSWSIPTFQKKYTFISRKILEYAFNLDQDNEYLLRSKLINSKINIYNNLQLDIHIALSSYIGKQPLIFKFYNFLEENEDNDNDSDSDDLFINMSNHNNNDKDYMIMYFFILNYDDI
jgi:hypothetical protein